MVRYCCTISGCFIRFKTAVLALSILALENERRKLIVTSRFICILLSNYNDSYCKHVKTFVFSTCSLLLKVNWELLLNLN
jgi:hypothetical protein